MDTPYSPEFLADRREALLAQKSATEAELQKIARFDEASGSWMAIQSETDPDTTEEADETALESETTQTNMALVKELETTLNDTLAALKKLDTDSYGVCEATGAWIDEERLIAYPAARTVAGLDQS